MKKQQGKVKPKESLGRVENTARGFQFIRFADHDGESCSLQQSSLAEYEPPGTSAVWLGCHNTRMHLDLKQVTALINHLRNWLRDGTF